MSIGSSVCFILRHCARLQHLSHGTFDSRHRCSNIVCVTPASRSNSAINAKKELRRNFMNLVCQCRVNVKRGKENQDASFCGLEAGAITATPLEVR